MLVYSLSCIGRERSASCAMEQRWLPWEPGAPPCAVASLVSAKVPPALLPLERCPSTIEASVGSRCLCQQVSGRQTASRASRVHPRPSSRCCWPPKGPPWPPRASFPWVLGGKEGGEGSRPWGRKAHMWWAERDVGARWGPLLVLISVPTAARIGGRGPHA